MTVLRQLYADLGTYSTAKQSETCCRLLRQLELDTTDNLASHFADALEANQVIARIERDFIPSSRGTSVGRNPVVQAMMGEPDLTVNISDSPPYTFNFLQREIPHLRSMTRKEATGKGWIDYVARTNARPILGEIKWKNDKSPFYAFIQLLMYLSEIATTNQILRSIEHRLYGDDIPPITTFDLHIFLANFNDRGAKGKLIQPTMELAKVFKQRLKEDGRVSANLLGNVLCLNGLIGTDSKRLATLECHWMV